MILREGEVLGLGMELLTERHSKEIIGAISCYDRILIQGTLAGLRRGQHAIATGLKLAQLVLIPQLAAIPYR
jgi:hypothetical protein